MSRKDELTGKVAQRGNQRSHAMNATKREFGLNLQKVTITNDGKKETLKVTAATRRTLKKKGKIA